MTINRSSEELEMREIIVPELRRRYPSARIIHELPLRYSTNRIDLAAVTENEIVSVEIKSSKDVMDRLEAQLRAFLPISSLVIVGLAPKWNEKLGAIKVHRPGRNSMSAYTAHVQQRTETQEIIRRVGHTTETWTVDAEAKTFDVTDGGYVLNKWPWLSHMLHMLHVSELRFIADEHRIAVGKRPTHESILSQCVDLMNGREIRKAVCAALRRRNAFCAGTDDPVAEKLAPKDDEAAA